VSSAAILRAHAKLKGDRWCPHQPHPKQAAFLALTDLEALYGGAAGGGKSDALLMAALQYVDVPGYAALLLRRTYADLALPGAIMDRSHTWLAGTAAHWDGEKHRWRFPSGATLSFGYLDTERDKYRYQGAELQFVGLDELTQFPNSWYIYLLSRLRRLKGSTVPLRARGATNPGGIGHRWVKERFVDEATALGTFVPALLDDNPSLDRDEYETALARLDPTTRQQLRHGVWVQDSGGLVYSSFTRSLIVPKPADLEGWRLILAFDFGVVDDTAWGILGWPKHSKNVHLIQSEKRTKMFPSEVGDLAASLEKQYRFDQIVGDEGGLGKAFAEEMRRRFGVPIVAAEKRNKLGYIKLMGGAMHNGEFLVCEGNDAYVEEVEELPWADETRMKEAAGLPNHLCDMALYGWRAASAWNEDDEPATGPKPGTPEWLAREQQREKEAAIEEARRRSAKQWRSGMR